MTTQVAAPDLAVGQALHAWSGRYRSPGRGAAAESSLPGYGQILGPVRSPFASPAPTPALEMPSCPACAGPPPSWLACEGSEAGRILVCGAVQSLLAGALNDSTEPAFARTLGVSGRHLRRLFLQHLGVTPAAMAAALRVQVARHLLATTEMKVCDVAFFVGFGSVRQFNRAMVETYGLSPRGLREQGSDDHVGGGSLSLRLPAPRRYDWRRILEAVDCSASPGVETVSGSTYRRVVDLEHDQVGIVEAHGSDAPGYANVRLHLPSWGRVVHIMERVRSMLGLNSDAPSGMDPVLPGSCARAPRPAVPEARPVCEWSAFEAAVKAVIGVPDDGDARDRLKALVESFGRPIVSRQFGPLRRFPSAHDLSKVPAGNVGLPMRIASPLVDLATAVAEGSMPISDAVPPNVRLRSLRSIDGVTDSMVERFAWLCGDGMPVAAGRRLRETVDPTPVAHRYLPEGAAISGGLP
jgi:AraC family transcriptional regulator of adaptative response / DNA-3-methyladenine glycosylase II